MIFWVGWSVHDTNTTGYDAPRASQETVNTRGQVTEKDAKIWGKGETKVRAICTLSLFEVPSL